MYAEHPSRLAGVVVWTAVASGAQRVLPDGCMDVIWLGDEVVVAGPDEVAHVSEAPAGTPCTGLRFAPGLLPPLLGVPAAAVTGQRVPLAEVWSSAEVERMGHEVALGAPRSAVLEARLAARRRHAAPVDPRLPTVVDGLAAGAPVAAVADAVGLSARQLHRRARDAFGYGPKVLARILRLTRALDLARAGVAPAAVAAATGYADQAHLAREVRALAGAPLREVLAPQPSAGSGA
ncbi:helix-turn-helix domain-containing protein [Iamia majanohamensis]|uniref:Helix-turn-helix domain-containing protein n=1 Tax=Iamia majanohamensis TaxID=467976 RepID=A0AAF0BXW0_9ACTN|nr:helix-turn-helix domain-containing protein [Iamia majanohamensis]WCO69264.1 helix-turn-helix domain-containing protein [Iamia majanohamensis]